MKRLRRYFILLWSSVLLTPALTRADFHEAAESEGLGNKVIGALGDVAGKAGLTPTDDSHELVPLDLIGLYLALVIGFVGVTFVIQIIHGGYLWMVAGGNEEQVTKARQKIINSATGAAIVFLAYMITTFVLRQITEFADIDAGFGTSS